jgi:hypothetical protein
VVVESDGDRYRLLAAVREHAQPRLDDADTG